jgi:hypothetical protein
VGSWLIARFEAAILGLVSASRLGYCNDTAGTQLSGRNGWLASKGRAETACISAAAKQTHHGIASSIDSISMQIALSIHAA